MTQPNNWREEFERCFVYESEGVSYHARGGISRGKNVKNDFTGLLDFISSLLASERERVLRIMKGMSKDEIADGDKDDLAKILEREQPTRKLDASRIGYNQALADLKKKLETEG